MDFLIPQLDQPGSIPRAVVAVAMLFGAAVVSGRVVGRRLLPTSLVLRLLPETCLGLNFLAWIGVIFGTTELLSGSRPAVVLVLCLAVGLVLASTRLASRAWRPNVDGQIRSLWRSRPTGWWLIGVLALVTFGQSLCYPTGWDELVYHNVLPRRWMRDGQLLVYPDLPYSAFPSLSEVLCWMMAPIDSLIAPRLFNWVCWFSAVIGLFQLCRQKHVSGGVTVCLVTATALSPAFLLIGANCYVETLVVLNVICLLLLLVQQEAFIPALTPAASSPLILLPTTAPLAESSPVELPSTSSVMPSLNDDRKVVLAAGVFAGACIATKLTAAMILFVPAVWIAALQIRRRRRWISVEAGWCRSGQLLTIYLTGAIAFASPFFFRTWLTTGTPLHPYFAWWFTDEPAVVEMSRFHHAIGADRFGVHSIEAFFTSPVLLAFYEDVYDGTFGWQMLVAAGMVAWGLSQLVLDFRDASAESLAKPRNRVAKKSTTVNGIQKSYIRGMELLWPAIGLLLLYVFWFATSQQARFLVPAVVVLTLLAAESVRYFSISAQKILAAVMLIAAFASLPLRTAGYYIGSWETVFDRLTSDEYVLDGTGPSYLSAARFLKEQTPTDSRVLMLFEHRGLYISRNHVVGTPYFQQVAIPGLTKKPDPDALAEFLRDEGFDYVFAANQPIGPDDAPDWHDRWAPAFLALTQATERGLLLPMWASDEHSIWRVATPKSP